jgi:hypothetical protein
MFTLLIAKKPVAVIDAPEPVARELLEQSDFHDDLMELWSNGEPLWNGSHALDIRPSTEAEIGEYEQGSFDGSEDGLTDEDDGEGTTVYFLVPIDEEDEDEDD